MTIEIIRTGTWFVLLTGIVGLIRFKRLSGTDFIILLIVLLNIIVDFGAVYLIYNDVSSAWLYNLFLPLEFTLKALVYYFSFNESIIKKLIITSIILVNMFILLNFNLGQGINTYNTNSFLIAGIFIMVFSYLIFRKYILEDKLSDFKLMNWFAIANFLYYLIAVPAISTSIWLIDRNIEYSKLFNNSNKFVYCLWSCLITTGFIWKRK